MQNSTEYHSFLDQLHPIFFLDHSHHIERLLHLTKDPLMVMISPHLTTFLAIFGLYQPSENHSPELLALVPQFKTSTGIKAKGRTGRLVHRAKR
uniref:Uncharacterized protein n=1 Tax=Arundo donax TaxID=35708 RepID=A0A0A9FPH7_ARUDO